ncbi:MAG TPA: hypothetical protein PKV35_01270 [bacterium]|nr:hypothetical protein [bacterium]
MNKMVIVFFMLFSFGFVWAQEQDTDEQGRLIKYREKTVIDFEDVMLEGQIKKPSGQFLIDRSKTKLNSLINLKKDFNKELVRSVDLLN